ncbi:adipocyte plasma membrane-associated protein Hemomucin-like [Phlebotomus papatasi]|uniref:adipocyte plasma membrane-associated protein Hemomucin-like n=1 Tax=Phlebotomus papatasi TaxID=29031 RepID=UPI0024837023|nr:adipocyte plasma membrane-associated protein Hemomucin-like [Phlebotomus papatasi]
MGLCCRCVKRFLYFLAFFFLVVLLPGVPPHTTFPFSPVEVGQPAELQGVLELNGYLNEGERLLEGRVHGPEHLLAVGGSIYTGIQGGEVIRINGDHITHVAKFGAPCEGAYEEAKCGRPLGMSLDVKKDHLIVADAFYGIWQVNLVNGKKQLLVSMNQEVKGTTPRRPKIANSVAVHSSGDIYWTDSCSDFGLDDGMFTMLANPAGRLIHYDRARNVSTTLIDEMLFANGLLLSPGEEFIVVAETGASRLRKYYLKGERKGTWQVFLDNLPGHPDNLSPAEDGFWVPLVAPSDKENPSLLGSLAKVPLVRKFLLRLVYLIQTPFRLISNAVPNVYTQKIYHAIGHFETSNWLFGPRVTILKVDWTGKIVAALHGTDGQLGGICHLLQVGEHYYLGSPFSKYMGRVKVPQHLMSKKDTPTTTTPRPTTTTSKPTTTAPPPKPTTTTPPPTTTTTPKPTTTTTTTTPKPTTTTPPPTKAPPKTTEAPPKQTIPIHEDIPSDTKPPPAPKLKVIKKGGEHGEL